MANTKKSKPPNNPKEKYDSSWMYDRRWPSDWPGEDPESSQTAKPDKSYQEIQTFLLGPTNKNPPEELKDLSIKEIRKFRIKNYSQLVPDEEPLYVYWYGTWALLEKVIDWCQENHFLYFSNKKFKRAWMRSNFFEKNKIVFESPHNEYKNVWGGTLETLIEFLLILEKFGAIKEPRIQRWAVHHFFYTVRGEARGINLYSLRAMWSTIKNSESGEGKKLTAEQRKALKNILKEIKLAR